MCATLGSERVEGLLHLGPRPTFAGSPPAIELFLIDFDRDLYGERVIVDVLHRLRGVRSFASGDDLVAQIAAGPGGRPGLLQGTADMSSRPTKQTGHPWLIALVVTAASRHRLSPSRSLPISEEAGECTVQLREILRLGAPGDPGTIGSRPEITRTAEGDYLHRGERGEPRRTSRLRLGGGVPAYLRRNGDGPGEYPRAGAHPSRIRWQPADPRPGQPPASPTCHRMGNLLKRRISEACTDSIS